MLWRLARPSTHHPKPRMGDDDIRSYMGSIELNDICAVAALVTPAQLSTDDQAVLLAA
jgi:hypothetical protein